MAISDKDRFLYSRRDFGKLALAGLPAIALVDVKGFAAIDSKIHGVQIGAITYSFRAIPSADDIIMAYRTIGLSEMELMSNHAEQLAGAPMPAAPAGRGRAMAPPAAAPGRQGGGRRVLTPEEQAEADARAEALRKWRMSASAATFTPVKKKIADAGIELRILCYNMNVRNTKDDEIEYGFMMAKALGARSMSTSTQVSMAKRTAPFADKYKIPLAFHGHDNLTDPDETATPESFATILAASKYHAINLDIGHFTAANFDPVPYIQQHHDRITHLHLKDRKKDHGANVPWGEGDTPIKAVLKLLEKNSKWDIPGNIEFEYPGDPVVEVGKCLEYCRQALA